MNIENTLKLYLEYINPQKMLTYDEYLRDCSKHQLTPINQKQWDNLISVLSDRKMLDTDAQCNALENVRYAFNDFNNNKILTEEEEEALRRDEKRGVYGEQEDIAN